MTILATFHPERKTSKVFNVIQYQIGIKQFHFEPLQQVIETSANTNTISSSNNIHTRETKLTLHSLKNKSRMILA